MANFQHKHGAFQWVFIYFKAVLYNDTYKQYLVERNSNPTSKSCKSLEDDFPLLSDLYDYFGDIHQYWKTTDDYPLFDQMFEDWKKANTNKLMLFLNGISPYKIVHAGETIETAANDVIFVIPKNYDIQEFRNHFAGIIDKAYETLSREWPRSLPFSLYRTDMIGGEKYKIKSNSISGFRGKKFSTERRVDAYIWKHRMGMKFKDCSQTT